MNLLNVLTAVYGKLHNYPGIPFWVLTPFRKITRGIANVLLPRYLSRPSYLVEYKGYKPVWGERDDKIIVSLTSFPERINYVWQVVVCMLSQTVLPEKILLWLSKEQFKSREDIPINLLKLENNIFQIKLVDGDIRSHKKYYYVLKEYPNDLIFLVDDDLYYPNDIIERSYIQHKRHPQSIISNYGYKVKFDSHGKHRPYSEWEYAYHGLEGHDCFFGSGGGTLLKVSMLSKQVTNLELALRLTPMADDIWLNAMSRLCRSTINILPFGEILPIKMKSKTLSSQNNGQHQNDVQIGKVEKFFGRCFDKFTDSKNEN